MEIPAIFKFIAKPQIFLQFFNFVNELLHKLLQFQLPVELKFLSAFYIFYIKWEFMVTS
jgi:hypothetical protein